ncbi:MAG: terpene cyclase/mutase family protein [Pirellulales bacterium]|nr:terpene cyclase/mutase family protein [Thermoguttaceae bacterium]MDD4789422.1 terpene cyclase/mutase family protein [Pirellulales bacterium]NLZ02134.1 terpene cyclase/mutase family protein [Pirellulaceae bacterium]
MALPNSPKQAAGQPLVGGFSTSPPQPARPFADQDRVPGGASSSESGSGGGNLPFGFARQDGGAGAAEAVPVETVELPEEDIQTLALKNAPPWLISAVFHMLVMIILALALFPALVNNQIDLEAVYAEQLGDQLEFDSPLAGTDLEAVEEPIITPDDLQLVDDPFAAAPELDVDVLGGTTASHPVDAAAIGVALNGREPGMKKALLAAYGGTALTSKSVADGLKWLARQQQKDGSWSLVGPYADGAVDENREAATAMALLAFQGDGNTAERGEHQKNVERGWYYLMRQQDADGCFFREGNFSHRFYTQGMATIAVCELYAMTKSEPLRATYREPAERAVAYCLKSQSPVGGWKYTPNGQSDVSVTGWILMGLQSARMAGLEVPQANLDKVSAFLDAAGQNGGSRYPYEIRGEPTRAMTAEGLLCRQFLGWKRNNPALVDGVHWLLEPENRLSFEDDRDVYYWYYASQVMHHMEGEPWEKWNGVMRQAVPENQVKEGREAGSWDPMKPSEDEWARHGGRLYVTCLSLYLLEVYYRHLPLYTNVYMYLQ